MAMIERMMARGHLRRLQEQWYVWRQRQKISVWHRVLGLYVFVFVVWGMYRVLFRMPVWVEEVILKGLVFGLPVFWLAFKKDRWQWKDMGVWGEGLFTSVYVGIILGIALGMVGQLNVMIRQGVLALDNREVSMAMVGSVLLLGLVTALWESLLFYGYMLGKVRGVLDELGAVVLVGGLYAVLHVPMLLFGQGFGLSQLSLSLVLLALLGIGNSILMLRFRNVAAPIMAQTLWGATLFLFS